LKLSKDYPGVKLNGKNDSTLNETLAMTFYSKPEKDDWRWDQVFKKGGDLSSDK